MVEGVWELVVGDEEVVTELGKPSSPPKAMRKRREATVNVPVGISQSSLPGCRDSKSKVLISQRSDLSESTIWN